MRILLALFPAVFLVSPATAADAPDARSVVLQFYQMAVNDRQPRAAFERYVAPDYIEHSSDVPGGGRAATLKFMEDLAATAPPQACRVERSIAEGDLVVLHARCRANPAGPELAIAEIFRVAQGKLVEHWDVIAPVRTPAINPASPF